MVEKNDNIELKGIPKTSEKDLSASLGCIRFNDSVHFLSSSLDSLPNSFIYIKHKSLGNF